MTIPDRTSSRWLAAAALALLVAGAFAPGQSRAECGAYVTAGGKKAPMASHNSTRPDAPKPCHGPNCSQHPISPVAPPAPAPTVTFGEWAELAGRLTFAGPGGSGFMCESVSGQPV